MTQLYRLLITFVIGACLLHTSSLRASHIVGAHLEMKALDATPGRYRVSLTYYFDQSQAAPYSNEALFLIFRKSDDARLFYQYAPVVARRQLTYRNAACSALRQLRTLEVTYRLDITLKPEDYADPGGYYLLWGDCCRNIDIDNIAGVNSSPLNGGAVGQVITIEFPPLLKDGKPSLNSSPTFYPLEGEYICRGQPYTLAFGAQDADGDELRYTIITPRYASRIVGSVWTGPHYPIQWVAGFSADNAIPGAPPLRVNGRTGELSVTATQLGLFAFAVKVEEYRRGQKIGETWREFQLLVIDCPPQTIPDPVIAISGQPVGTNEAAFCEGNSLTLSAPNNPAWEYQWRRDGILVPGASTPSLTVSDSGRYTVLASVRDQCSRTSQSQSVQIRLTTSRFRLSADGPLRLCGPDGTVLLSAPVQPEYTYAWTQNGTAIAGSQAATLTVREPGRYAVLVRDTRLGCTSRSDTLTLVRRPLPIALLQPATTSSELCTGDSLRLDASGGASYTWLRDGQSLPVSSRPTYYARQAGLYAVRVSDSTGCTAVSDTFRLRLVERITVTLDSLPAWCGSEHGSVALKGSPTGGVFAGPGVTGETFDPRRAGLGRHEVTYTVSSSLACRNGTARRVALIQEVPQVRLPTEIRLPRGGRTELNPSVVGQPVAYQWTPSVYLTDASQPMTTAEGVTDSVTYRLEVITQAGCRGWGQVRLRVYDRLWIPDAFSPNGDGVNDRWEIQNLALLPEASVTVYNRWGEIVFRGNGTGQRWDGRVGGQPVPSGVYAYQIQTPEHTYRGSLQVTY
jgi:gliding motility-associated-like protein